MGHKKDTLHYWQSTLLTSFWEKLDSVHYTGNTVKQRDCGSISSFPPVGPPPIALICYEVQDTETAPEKQGKLKFCV